MDETNFDEFVLANMPYFIAVNYQQLLEAQKPQKQVELIVHIYNLGLRMLTINLVSQYLFQDRGRVDDADLNELLYRKFLGTLTIEVWKETFFAVLRAYKSKKHLLFMPELYDFYWDTSTFPHRGHAGIELPFERLAQATMELQKKYLLPQDESGWKELAEELMGHLLHILHSLSFIGTYELIHVIGQDEQFYYFELHKGLGISKGHQLLPKLTKLDSGWFYLRAGTEKFLSLHPLIVFWKDKIEPTDTGVFDRLVSEQLRYLLTLPSQTRVDHEYLEEFVMLIYSAIEERRHKPQAEKLTWERLRSICEDITQQRMATVRGRYQKELYLQRDEVRQKFESFLADPKKRGFILVGKSGVGKSNFLLALGEELHQSRDDVCMITYDGANLQVALSITGFINRDFSDRLVLSGQQVQQVWHEIAKIDGIDERLVILCVDAINENLQATELLRQLDELVQGPWPWLKIVFSSRPETWQAIKRGIKLAEALYYREQGTETLSVELEPFSYSERVEPFSRQELPNVYAKYQHVFKLQTLYNSLSQETLVTLQDPLNLLIVSKTYQMQKIPSSVKTSELIEQYVRTLHVRTLLQREDLQFLENQLIPLMVSKERYRNVITRADIEAKDDTLYNAVYSQQELSNGQRTNESFCRLLDADILVHQNQKFEDRIAFKYERFYEYFVGRRIFSLSGVQGDQYTFYQDLIEETAHSPFLWGAVRNALVQEAKERGSETILKLSITTQQRVKEMMVSVLITLGLDVDATKQVEGILTNLIPQEKKATEWRKAKQLLSKTPEVFPIASRNAGRIATEVASRLNLPRILQIAALQEDSTIRTAAVRYSYHLWQRHPEKGYEVLESLAENATRGLIPNTTAFESVFGLSLVIFFGHFQDKSVIERLQIIWHKIIAKFLHIQEKRSSWEDFVREFIRERLFSLVITIAFRLFRENPAYTMINYQGLETFFQLGIAEKALYRNLVQYLDVKGSYAKEQLENDYLQAIKLKDVLINIATISGLIAHVSFSPLAFLPFLRKLLNEAKRDIDSPYPSDIAHILEELLVRDPMSDEMFDFYVDTIKACHEYYAKYPKGLRNPFSEAPEIVQLGPYIYLQYQRTGSVRTPWLETRIQTALSRSDIAFFELFFTYELPLVAIEHHKPQIALDALALFFKSIVGTPSQSSRTEIRQKMQSFLARLRMYYPDDVDEFLEEQQVPNDFRLHVQTNEPIETIGVLIGEKAQSFVLNDVLLNSPNLLSQYMHILERASYYNNARTWIDFFSRDNKSYLWQRSRASTGIAKILEQKGRENDHPL